jgi:hypothetical protein
LVAYKSQIAADQELSYLCKEMTELGLEPGGGVVSGMCIADRGFWLLGEDDRRRRWQKLRVGDPGDPLSYFVGVVSNSCFDQRAKRQGLQPLGGGIGQYIGHPFEWVSA